VQTTKFWNSDLILMEMPRDSALNSGADESFVHDFAAANGGVWLTACATQNGGLFYIIESYVLPTLVSSIHSW
jgi:hypothetical protein